MSFPVYAERALSEGSIYFMGKSAEQSGHSEHRDARGVHEKEARRSPGYTRALLRRKDGINNVNYAISAFNIRLNDYRIVHR